MDFRTLHALARLDRLGSATKPKAFLILAWMALTTCCSWFWSSFCSLWIVSWILSFFWACLACFFLKRCLFLLLILLFLFLLCFCFCCWVLSWTWSGTWSWTWTCCCCCCWCWSLWIGSWFWTCLCWACSCSCFCHPCWISFWRRRQNFWAGPSGCFLSWPGWPVGAVYFALPIVVGVPGWLFSPPV